VECELIWTRCEVSDDGAADGGVYTGVCWSYLTPVGECDDNLGLLDDLNCISNFERTVELLHDCRTFVTTHCV